MVRNTRDLRVRSTKVVTSPGVFPGSALQVVPTNIALLIIAFPVKAKINVKGTRGRRTVFAATSAVVL